MTKFLGKLSAISRWVVVGAIGGFLLFYLLFLIGIMSGTNNAGTILTNLYAIALVIAVYGFAMFLLLAKWDAIGKKLLPLFLAFLVLYQMIYGDRFGFGGVTTVMWVMESMCLLGFIVIYILKTCVPSLAGKAALSIVALALLGGFALFHTIYVIVYFVQLGQAAADANEYGGGMNWGYWMVGIAMLFEIAIIPFLYLFLSVPTTASGDEGK